MSLTFCGWRQRNEQSAVRNGTDFDWSAAPPDRKSLESRVERFASFPGFEWNFPFAPNYTRKAFGGFQGLPLHVDFIWNRGAYIIEIMNLDELAKDQAYEFLFLVAPLLLRGGIGVPVNPIAIR